MYKFRLELFSVLQDSKGKAESVMLLARDKTLLVFISVVLVRKIFGLQRQRERRKVLVDD